MNLERITMSNTEAVVVQKAIDIVKEHSNWISVDERLPEDRQEVLIFVADGFFGAYMTVSYYNGNGHIKSWNNIYLNETVTHWQPLPSPPSEVQDGNQ